MTTKEIAEILQEDRKKITNIVKKSKLPIKRLNSGYWFKESDIELVRKEINKTKQRSAAKVKFLKTHWNAIKDDNQRDDIIDLYGEWFGVGYLAAALAVNRFFLDESQRIYKENKPRIETREDGTVVQVFQSKINIES